MSNNRHPCAVMILYGVVLTLGSHGNLAIAQQQNPISHADKIAGSEDPWVLAAEEQVQQVEQTGYVERQARQQQRQSSRQQRAKDDSWVWNQMAADVVFLPFMAITGKPGNDRSLGEGHLFMPLVQDETSLVFSHIRGQFDDREALEANFGLGYRSLVDSAYIVGGYAYYDLLHSSFGNNFSQLTVGAEMFSLDWDLRINGYLPEGGSQSAGAEAAISNGTIVITGFQEKASPGFDAEAGYRFAAWGENDDVELRVFGGGYYFDAAEAITGPRGRLELRAYDLPLFGMQSRFETGVEASYDSVRNEQLFYFARLRVPLFPRRGSQLDPLRRRMTDTPISDIDVVSKKNKGKTELALNAFNGKSFGTVTMTDQNNTMTAVANAGQNNTVIVNGAPGGMTSADQLALLKGQALLGGGSTIQVLGAESGTTATFHVPGMQPVIQNTNMTSSAIGLNDDTTVVGFNIQSGMRGVGGNGVSNVAVSQVAVSGTSGSGVDLNSVSNSQLIDLLIQQTGLPGINVQNSTEMALLNSKVNGAAGAGVNVANSSNVMVAHNEITNTGTGVNVTNTMGDLEIKQNIIDTTTTTPFYTGGGVKVAGVAGDGMINISGNDVKTNTAAQTPAVRLDLQSSSETAPTVNVDVLNNNFTGLSFGGVTSTSNVMTTMNVGNNTFVYPYYSFTGGIPTTSFVSNVGGDIDLDLFNNVIIAAVAAPPDTGFYNNIVAESGGAVSFDQTNNVLNGYGTVVTQEAGGSVTVGTNTGNSFQTGTSSSSEPVSGAGTTIDPPPPAEAPPPGRGIPVIGGP